jgi:hypothetical protein
MYVKIASRVPLLNVLRFGNANANAKARASPARRVIVQPV